MLIQNKHHFLKITLALVTLYLLWGASYLFMKFAIESFAPLLMGAIRFTTAGLLLFAWLKLRGTPNPNMMEWFGAGIVGVLLLSIGNACVAIAEQYVSSGASALALATVPIWMVLFSRAWGHKTKARELWGIAIGIIGMVILHSGDEMKVNHLGTILLMISPATWALGSVWGKHLPMPKGAMASASQMIIAGIVLLIASTLRGESWPTHPSLKATLSLAYLIVFASLIAYSAYGYLLHNVRPSLATSNTFVNPIVAMLLGVWLAGEHIGIAEYVASFIILLGVTLVFPWNKKELT